MKFAYADPPYPGCAHLYPEKTEVDHAELIERLCADYGDGWALSTSATALKDVLPLCPGDCRIAAWVKPFAVFRPNVNPAYTWEPVIFRGGRRGDRTRQTVRDHHAAGITLQRGLVGVKPDSFNLWVLDLLGFTYEDELHDLFPGSGGMGVAVERLRRSLERQMA